MRKLLPFWFVILAGISFTGCLGRQKVGGGSAETTADPVKTIVIPTPPAIMTAPEEQAQFYALHYWDNFDFADTTYVDVPEVTEQAFSDYLAILSVNPPATVNRSVKELIDKASVDEAMYRYFAELFERYLDDPNSPMRNEELYIAVLENTLSSERVDELDKLRPRAKLTSALKNRVGTRAADIVLTTDKGEKIRLYDIRSPYTLLYFNNPDCIHCEEVTGHLKGSSDMLMPLVRQGVLSIVAIYPDEDLAAWHNHLEDLPAEWYRTYDGSLSIRRDNTYDLRAIPSLYLLDSEKTVVLKDIGQVWQIEAYFSRLGY